jgi:pimeloyl-ACP methyl ester carboxylesterase
MMASGHAEVQARRHWSARVGLVGLGLFLAAHAISAQTTGVHGPSEAAPAALPASAQPARPTIIIGFLGGFVAHTDRVHGPVRFAEHLRQIYPAIRVETFENHRADDAEKAIVAFVQSARQGKFTGGAASEAQVILYGHSWGASATVSLARRLERDGIPVTLTVQVDSIASFGHDDSLIPANVAHAVNFYQRSGLLRGEPAIKAADPKHTEILGNFRFDYDKHPVTCEGYPWWNHVFSKTHMEIECDPQVWGRVESFVRSELETGQSRTGGGL